MKREEGEACEDRDRKLEDAGERAGQLREGVSHWMLKQRVGCAPSKEAMGYAQRPVVGLESDADVEGSVATFVSCESFGSRMY
jgi:hypothetical protein